MKVSVLLVGAAEAMALTHGDVGLVNWLDVGLSCHDDIVTDVLLAHPPPAKQKYLKHETLIQALLKAY